MTTNQDKEPLPDMLSVEAVYTGLSTQSKDGIVRLKAKPHWKHWQRIAQRNVGRVLELQQQRDELLAALKRIAHFSTPSMGFDANVACDEIRRDARAAISRAEGKA